MANEKQLVRVLTEPTIVLDKLESQDGEAGTSDAAKSQAVKTSKQLGGLTPLIQILQRTFQGEDVASLQINANDQIPTITVDLLIRDKSFYSQSFPKDGDIMNVFIRSKDDVFKPIRNDYEITRVYVDSRPGGGENSLDTVTISGSLRIPGYNAKKCFAKKGTSMRTVLETATDLKLGFASNEVDTQDSQTWLCPFEKTRDFLEEVTLSAWKDTKSFFSFYVDYYYYLNFVNIEPLFSEKTEIEEGMLLSMLTNDYGKDNEQGKQKAKVVLTNWDESSDSPYHMLSHTLINNSGINLNHGYKRYVQYYDELIKEPQSIFVDPLTTEGSENTQQLLKGRPGENFYLEQIESKWLGIQYGDSGENSHEKYNYARIHNYQNLVHIGKMGLKVMLNGINPNIRKMQSVPVICVLKRDDFRKTINEPEDQSAQAAPPNTSPNKTTSALSAQESPITIDKTISGFYVVWGIKIIYDQGTFKQELILYRREWPTPPSSH